MRVAIVSARDKKMNPHRHVEEKGKTPVCPNTEPPLIPSTPFMADSIGRRNYVPEISHEGTDEGCVGDVRCKI